MKLRPYQRDVVDAVYRHLQDHDDNPVVVLPMAAGKTPCLATICRDAVKQWNGRVLVVSHVKELLQQAVDKLKLVDPDLPVGVYSAGLKRRDTGHPIIVAGIQSIYKRACDLDAFDLIIIDECHLLPPDGDGMYQRFLADAKVINPHVRVIGFTATPFRLDSGQICRPDGFLNHICYEVGDPRVGAGRIPRELASAALGKQPGHSAQLVRHYSSLLLVVGHLLDGGPFTDCLVLILSCREQLVINYLKPDKAPFIAIGTSLVRVGHIDQQHFARIPFSRWHQLQPRNVSSSVSLLSVGIGIGLLRPRRVW